MSFTATIDTMASPGCCAQMPTSMFEAPRLSTPRLALSVRQPWAWAILYAGKRIENRTWQTTYRGQLFIHAGLRVDYAAVDDLSEVITNIPAPRPVAYCGALIATAMLVDCVPIDDVPVDQRTWAGGPWCFILDDVRPLARAIPQRGALGLFAIHPRAELRALEQI
jgi:hypothetical protein